MSSQNKYRGLSVIKTGDGVFLFYQNLAEKKPAVRIARSADGNHFEFSKETLHFKYFLGLKRKMKLSGPLTISRMEQKFHLIYQGKGRKNQEALCLAISENGIHWKKSGTLDSIKGRAFILKTKSAKEPYLMVFGNQSIKVAVSSNHKDWQVKKLPLLKPRRGHFDSEAISVTGFISCPEGLAVLYSSKNSAGKIGLGAALFDNRDYRKILWRSQSPLWIKPDSWNAKELTFVGCIYRNHEILSYFGYKNKFYYLPLIKGRVKEFKKINRSESQIPEQIELKKFEGNPIIKARPHNDWESNETFNPAAISIGDKVHFLYRAVGNSGMSVFGYASSHDGFTIDERLDQPAYVPTEPFEFIGTGKPTFSYPYMSGGGWGGCEDPRLTQIEDDIYLTYTAFNGCHAPGVALSSIKVSDFLKKIWKWKKPILLSKPGEIQKNWLLFPEKIRGKFAILHSINPEITIDYFDDLSSAEMAINSVYNTKGKEYHWDNLVRGAAAPPIKTEFGWLVLYHAMDRKDHKHYQPGYWNKVGAILLDYNEPEKIISRYHKPILEATEHYEKEGCKPGVVYVCGSIIKEEKLFVYYGGADSVSCVATMPLKEFLLSLVNSPVPIQVKQLART